MVGLRLSSNTKKAARCYRARQNRKTGSGSLSDHGCRHLVDRVLPFYQAVDIGVGAILTDNSREFCAQMRKCANAQIANGTEVVNPAGGCDETDRPEHVPYFNRRHRRTGTLWESRFKSCRVDDDGYLMTVYRYIEQSRPRRHGRLRGV
jgi:hypothetical protein